MRSFAETLPPESLRADQGICFPMMIFLWNLIGVIPGKTIASRSPRNGPRLKFISGAMARLTVALAVALMSISWSPAHLEGENLRKVKPAQ
ncbi:hypothetical protein Pfl01_1330 [Pseudomonas fluorescens Pf0-1]|uniref:Uncharacterized protein n=1 Tax=Pseudomonas fluorescens (strain Pf0-1) TaxID=205922 RepID=Q3KGN3_PSEPF|nr:hypothetical protein Pfl01_1330 [Pseudomonas fluorescens Pf0-1]